MAKRGISTVLGVLLMVGILFTTIIPIYIYVNAVNNYYDRTVVDMKIADQERSMEDLDVYAWGSADTNDSIDVFLENKGSISLNVVRIWAMRTDLQKTLIFTAENDSSPLPLQLNPSNQTTIFNLNLSTILESSETDYFNIYVTTARGNKFTSKTNPLHHNGGWVTSTKPPWITVFIYSDQDNDHYRVTAVCEDSGKTYTREYYHVNGYFSFVMDVTEFSVYNVTAWNIKVNGDTNYEIDSILVCLDLETWLYTDIAPAPFDDLNN